MCKVLWGYFYPSLEWLGDDPWKPQTISVFYQCACCCGQEDMGKDINHKNGLNLEEVFNSLYSTARGGGLSWCVLLF